MSTAMSRIQNAVMICEASAGVTPNVETSMVCPNTSSVM
jgi:hypothetical protein